MGKKKLITPQRILFLFIFLVLVLIGKNINFSALVGAENQFLTMFQFFGPIAGGFLGSVFGAIAVLGAQIIDFILVGKEISLINLIRLTPMIFAAYYFGTKKKHISVIIPLLAITAFVMHPVGRTVWFFALFWTIPVIIKLIPGNIGNNVLLKSLGSTFTAHSVGGAAWIWSIQMPAEAWIALIPIVAFERSLFACGIAGSYLVMNTVLDKFKHKFSWISINKAIYTDKRLVLSKKVFKSAI